MPKRARARPARHHRRRRRRGPPAGHGRRQDHRAGAGRAGAVAYLRGEDSLLSIVQMPKGVPVSTFAIGEAGAANAALTAVAMLAATDDALAAKLEALPRQQTAAAKAMTLPLE
jgi:hypothetical protein